MANTRKKAVVTEEITPDTTIIVDETPVIPTVEAVEEEKEPEETITVNLAAPKKNPNVKIRLGKPFRGRIGGTVYDFKRGEVAIVPENVRRILSKEEGLLRPL